MFSDEEVEQSFIQAMEKDLPSTKGAKRKRRLTSSPEKLVAWCQNKDPNSPESDIEEALRR